MNIRTRLIYITITSMLLSASPVQGAMSSRKLTAANPYEAVLLSTRPEHIVSQNALNYPADPTADIPWSAGTNGVADIQAAFNSARAVENSQLGTSIPLMTLPSQTEWNGMSDGQKALWLINRERIDRGVAPLDGLETNVGSVAQYYANYLLTHNTWGHTADGRDPWQRLNDNPAIGACHDFLSISENLAVFVTSGSSIPLPIEQAIYMWMYEDGSCCGWGHRHAILWYPYNDNSGPAGREGFLGIGRANGGPYQGPFSQSWPFAEILVMNVFDPCPAWSYSYLPGVATLNSPSGAITDTTPTFTWSVSPDTDTQDPATWYYLWIDGPAGNIFKQWYASSSVCTGGTCSVNSPVTLGGGNHQWRIQTWNSAGYGPWTGPMNFSLPTVPPPGAAALLSPNGSIAVTMPTYSWNKVNAATWYYLWVSKVNPNGSLTTVYTKWYESGTVCGASNCSVAPAGVTLSNGNYRWWIQTWNNGGYGPWSSMMNFSVNAIPPPGAAALVSPDGSIADTTPTYTWNKVNAATWYYLWVSRVNSNGTLTTIHTKWYASTAACAGSTCSITPAGITLSNGSYRWWIQTWNDGGYGPWSNPKNFMIVP